MPRKDATIRLIDNHFTKRKLSFKKKIQATEMRYLRKIEEQTRRDRIRSATIRSSLNVQPAEEVLEQNRLRWFWHVVRMDSDSGV